MSATRSGGTLLVASTGGHLEELLHLSERLVPKAESQTWVTFDDPQSRSLLTEQPVHYVPYVPPRGYAQSARVVLVARKLLQSARFDRIVSTGAGVAIPFLALGRMYGAQCHYIESAARAQAPSLTGKVASKLPGVRLYTQYQAWASARWQYRGSLFDAYEQAERRSEAEQSISRVVVTLGTMRTYGFRRAVERLTRVLPQVLTADAEVLWQVGCTDVSGLGIAARDRVPAEELRQAVAEADLVIAHAGVGSALTALDRGKCPVLLRRSKAHGEHVDDHQRFIADGLDARGIAVSIDPSDLTPDAMSAAASRSVQRAGTVPAFHLAE